MTNLEELIRDTLTARAADAPAGANLLDTVRDGDARTRPGRRSMAVLAAVGVVALIAVGVSVFVAVGHHSSAPAPQPFAASTTGPKPSSIPPGMRLISFHGIEFLVPTAWNAGSRCGAPMGNTVMIDDGSPTTQCLITGPPGLMVVRVGASTPAAPDRIATDPVSIDGHAALRGTGTIKVWELVPGTEKSAATPEQVAALTIPDVGVDLRVQGPDTAAAARILDSVRVVRVDAFGCVQHRTPLTPSAPSNRPGAAAALVPPTPGHATICRYRDNWLVRAVTLPTGRLHRLVDILDALPTGVSHPGGNYGRAPKFICIEDAQRGFVVRFTYAEGAPLLVYVHIGGCTTLSASNGSRTTKIDSLVDTFLVDAAGYDGALPAIVG